MRATCQCPDILLCCAVGRELAARHQRGHDQARQLSGSWCSLLSWYAAVLDSYIFLWSNPHVMQHARSIKRAKTTTGLLDRQLHVLHLLSRCRWFYDMAVLDQMTTMALM